MKACMLVAGMSKCVPYFEDMDYIGIDRGALCCLQQGISMVCAIGDFDSVTSEELKQIKHLTDVLQLPAHKNETDSEAGILYALDHSYDRIILYGALGGRLDHELANLYLLLYRYPSLELRDEHHSVKVLCEGDYQIEKEFKYLSFLALEPSCISECGVAYPLDHQHIDHKDIYTISNEIIDQYAQITIHEGRVLMIACEDKK